ncbi:MAG: divergent PAP2 family protein [Candidatus Gracilibacteria bacterium]|nr:divergent PAP2 family protein [Candidatus Gracilibacteria bacterium]MDD2908909.1 divergent PAP2 family protein [Candidatus Gracilibacteria bacterium]
MNGLFYNNILLVPVFTWIFSVILKGIYLKSINKFSISNSLGSGGMPSVHSALVTSITTAIGVKYGVFGPNSDLFAASVVFSMIIIYDAINVRFEAGLHAKTLNELTGKQYNFNESIGHLPKEAFVGSLIGIFSAYILMMI